MRTAAAMLAAAMLLACSMIPMVPMVAQSAPRPRKVLTPDQAAYQQASAAWLTRYNALRTRARTVLAAEQARAKAGDCPQADTTRAQEECLSREIATTRANYAAVLDALRAMLALTPPTMPGERPVSGPTGTPLTPAARLAELDALEQANADYRKLADTAAYNEFKGGTLAPVFALEAEQELLRSHLNELAFVYSTEFSTR